MKFTAVALVAAAAVVSAQSIGDIPSCAQTCLLPALQATGCDLTDFKCSCSNTEFVTGSTACIQKACSPADQEKAAKATYELCKSVGVEIPTQPPTQPAPSTTEAPEPAPTVTRSEVEQPTYSVPEQTTTHTPAPSSYVPPAPSTIETSTSANGTQTTLPPAPTYTGGASLVAGNVLLAVGGAVAAFFL